MMFAKPRTALRIPPAITTLHNGKPKFSTLVAFLLRLPRMLKPRMIIELPRKENPEFLLSIGQNFSKYGVNMESSETMRKRPMLEVKK